MPDQSAISQLLDEVRAGLERVGPHEAADIAARGGLLVDTRPFELRRRFGTIPGALVVDRNVLEWRLDPTSPHRLPEVQHADQEVVVVCQEGYASSLAAASLRSLGLKRATDLDGGFAAWQAAGLPVEAPEGGGDRADGDRRDTDAGGAGGAGAGLLP